MQNTLATAIQFAFFGAICPPNLLIYIANTREIKARVVWKVWKTLASDRRCCINVFADAPEPYKKCAAMSYFTFNVNGTAVVFDNLCHK